MNESPSPHWHPSTRWCGFNLLGMFVCTRPGSLHADRYHKYPGTFSKLDFQIIADWGFNFVRIPMDYRWWASTSNPRILQDSALQPLEQALSWAEDLGIHVQLNFHRAPGYCINPPAEPLDLFRDPQALETCALHWAHFANHFRGIPNDRLSFDLVNEPANHSQLEYDRTHLALISAIHASDPSRLIIANGGSCGRTPHPALFSNPLVGQAMRGYDPQESLSHWRAEWTPADWDHMPPPTWPPNPSNPTSGIQWLCQNVFDPWEEARSHNVLLLANEFGCHNQTPHPVALAWLEDMLSIWKHRNIGWALWNLSGSFGVLNSNRPDVQYSPFHHHALDTALLSLLQKYL